MTSTGPAGDPVADALNKQLNFGFVKGDQVHVSSPQEFTSMSDLVQKCDALSKHFHVKVSFDLAEKGTKFILKVPSAKIQLFLQEANQRDADKAASPATVRTAVKDVADITHGRARETEESPSATAGSNAPRAHASSEADRILVRHQLNKVWKGGGGEEDSDDESESTLELPPNFPQRHYFVIKDVKEEDSGNFSIQFEKVKPVGKHIRGLKREFRSVSNWTVAMSKEQFTAYVHAAKKEQVEAYSKAAKEAQLAEYVKNSKVSPIVLDPEKTLLDSIQKGHTWEIRINPIDELPGRNIVSEQLDASVVSREKLVSLMDEFDKTLGAGVCSYIHRNKKDADGKDLKDEQGKEIPDYYRLAIPAAKITKAVEMTIKAEKTAIPTDKGDRKES